MFGEPVSSETKKSGEVSPTGESETGRRSIYQIVRRSAPQNFLNAFDAPVMEINCIRRARSTSATQALALMNGDFITAQAEHFAKRVLEKAPAEEIQRTRRKYGTHFDWRLEENRPRMNWTRRHRFSIVRGALLRVELECADVARA